MTRRAVLLFLCALLFLFCALSTQGSLFWLLFWVLLLMLLYGFLSALWTRRTLSVRCALDQDRVTRGAQVQLSVALSHRCPLPVAAIELAVCAPGDTGLFSLFIAARPFTQNTLRQPLYCPHVGEYPAGVTGVFVQDVFGLFSLRHRGGVSDGTLVVKPQVYHTEPLSFSPGDSEMESLTRAFADATLPTDVRAYQQGDELKKVHWKLSMRKKELLVRVYEQPMRPDALLLVDCAPPVSPSGDEASVRDAICEAAASVAMAALSEGAPVRMPLLTDTPTDISAQKSEDVEMVLNALGRCAFDGAQQFERVLLLETRRLRRTGSTAIVTSRMNPVIADMILRIRRMGPKVRVLLAADVQDEAVAELVRRLVRNDVEVMPIAAELA